MLIEIDDSARLKAIARRGLAISAGWAVNTAKRVFTCGRCGCERTGAEWPRQPAGRRTRFCGLCESPTAPKGRERRLQKKRERGARYRVKRRSSPARVAAAEAREQARIQKQAAVAARMAAREAAKIGPCLTDAARYRLRCARDVGFLINGRMRTAINKALRGGKSGRKWELLVGYTLAELIARLKSRMPSGFTLEDFHGGRLHIDHVRPKCLYDVTTLEGLRAAWALDNLQPLPAIENIRKGAKYVD